MIEALIWIGVIVGIPALLAGLGMGAAFVVAGRADRRKDDFCGDQWP